MKLFKKKEEKVDVKPVTDYDPIDKLEMYLVQLNTDHNFGYIDDEFYVWESERILKGIERIRALVYDVDFDRKVHDVIESIFNERGKDERTD